MNNTNFYTKGEEIANAITHGIGALLAVTALILLIILSVSKGNSWQVVSYTIFGISLVILYTSSTLYHSITNMRAKRVFRKLDHCSIYFLIAGTYTPYTLTVLRSTLGWIIFSIIWTMAIAGIVVKSIWVGKYDRLSTLIYIIMGWMILISINRLWLLLPQLSFILLVLGGVTYTLGAILYSIDKIPYNHPIWHIFVLTGSAMHFFSVIYML